MTDIVDETLRNWGRGSHIWGKTDCMLSVADFILEVTGIDYGVRFRGRYDDEAGARAAMAAYGGPVALLDYTGLATLAGPRRGAVCVVETNGGDRIGALCTGDAIAVRLERGVVEVSVKLINVIKYWDCYNGRG